MSILGRMALGGSGSGVTHVFGDVGFRRGKMLASGKTTPGKWAIDIRVEPVYALTNGHALALPVAEAILQQIKTRMLSGGLGASPGSTVRRRTFRDAQYTRGGWPADKRKTASGEMRSIWRKDRPWSARIAREYALRRFRATKLGRFSPLAFGNGMRGVESGMLVASLKAGMGNGGRGVSIYAAGRRSMASPTSGSAVQRVFGSARGRALLNAAMATTPVRAAAQQAAEDMIAVNIQALMMQVRQSAIMLRQAVERDWSLD